MFPQKTLNFYVDFERTESFLIGPYIRFKIKKLFRVLKVLNEKRENVLNFGFNWNVEKH